MQHRVHRAFDVERQRDVGPYERESRVRIQMGDVLRRPGAEVVHAHDLVTGSEQPVAQVRAEEPRTAGDDGPAPGVRSGVRSGAQVGLLTRRATPTDGRSGRTRCRCP